MLIILTIILHLGIGLAIAMHGYLFRAALVSASIALLPVLWAWVIGSPHELEAALVFMTPLVAISLLVALAGAVMALARWHKMNT